MLAGWGVPPSELAHRPPPRSARFCQLARRSSPIASTSRLKRDRSRQSLCGARCERTRHRARECRPADVMPDSRGVPKKRPLLGVPPVSLGAAFSMLVGSAVVARDGATHPLWRSGRCATGEGRVHFGCVQSEASATRASDGSLLGVVQIIVLPMSAWQPGGHDHGAVAVLVVQPARFGHQERLVRLAQPDGHRVGVERAQRVPGWSRLAPAAAFSLEGGVDSSKGWARPRRLPALESSHLLNLLRYRGRSPLPRGCGRAATYQIGVLHICLSEGPS